MKVKKTLERIMLADIMKLMYVEGNHNKKMFNVNTIRAYLNNGYKHSNESKIFEFYDTLLKSKIFSGKGTSVKEATKIYPLILDVFKKYYDTTFQSHRYSSGCRYENSIVSFAEGISLIEPKTRYKNLTKLDNKLMDMVEKERKDIIICRKGDIEEFKKKESKFGELTPKSGKRKPNPMKDEEARYGIIHSFDGRALVRIAERNGKEVYWKYKVY